MRCIKVPLRELESVKKQLVLKELLVSGYQLLKENGFAYLPVSGTVKGYRAMQKDLVPVEKHLSLKEALRGVLSTSELELFSRSFDLIGDIAILEIGDKLLPKAQSIAEMLLRHQAGIQTVLRKEAEHSGVFRVRGYRYLAGKKKTETLHRESGVQLKLDVTKVYFSPRLSHERLRVASLVKANERVLTMFSGIGVYPLVISKHSQAQEIVGVEINPDASAYAEENILLNKVKNVRVLCGDVRDVSGHLGLFDRIIMPLPKTAEHYLPLALKLSHPGCVIHLYTFLKEDGIEAFQKTLLENYPQLKVLEVVKCGQVKPHEFRVCFDLAVQT